MPKVRISSAQGVVQSAGGGIHIDQAPRYDVISVSADATISHGGVYTLEGSAATTTTMPQASTVPGATFTFRNTAAVANILTGSSSDSAKASFCGTIYPGGNISSSGSAESLEGDRLTLSAVAGASVSLVCDGNKYLIMATSGSVTLAGYPN